MTKITEALNLVLKAAGKQPVKDCDYRPLTYTRSYEVDRGLLVYNFMTGSLILLEHDEIDAFLNPQNFIDKEVKKELIENWFLVPVENDDVTFANQLNAIMRFTIDSVKRPPITSYTIYPTTDCNARCFYCFELAKSSRIPMSPKVASDVGDYMLKASGGKPITIRWFGGEPLCNTEAMDIIGKRLQEANAEYKASMVSNGYLFDDVNVEKAKNLWNVSRVQITLDGTEEIYNRVKAFIYKDGTSAFKRVMDNIERLLKADIYVSVRMNMDEHNADDLYALVDMLAERFGKYDKFMAYSHLLFENSTIKQKNRSDAERHLLIERFFAFEDYIESKGIAMERGIRNMLRFKQCMTDNNAATTVLPDGHLGKCEHFTEDHFWGSIYSDEIDENIIAQFKEVFIREGECDTCPIKPACLQLKMCPDIPKHCDEYDRKMQNRNIKKFILTEYKYFLKKEKENET